MTVLNNINFSIMETENEKLKKKVSDLEYEVVTLRLKLIKSNSQKQLLRNRIKIKNHALKNAIRELKGNDYGH